MKKGFQHIFAISMSFLLFGSTVGVSLNTLYCFCKGEMTTSFFQIEDNCSLSDKPLCCKSKGKSCKIAVDKEHNCDTKNSKYLKLDVEVVQPEFDFHKFTLNLASFRPVYATFTVNIPNQVLAKNLNKAPPLIINGQTILLLKQSYLC